MAKECVDTLHLRAYLAHPPLREGLDAVTRDLQSTNRYEHSLDSAMRPVRPDGISRRTREHPSDTHLPEEISRAEPRSSTGEPLDCFDQIALFEQIESCVPRRPGPHDHLRSGT